MTENQMLELMERMMQWVCDNVDLTQEQWIMLAKIRMRIQHSIIDKETQENE